VALQLFSRSQTISASKFPNMQTFIFYSVRVTYDKNNVLFLFSTHGKINVNTYA